MGERFEAFNRSLDEDRGFFPVLTGFYRKMSQIFVEIALRLAYAENFAASRTKIDVLFLDFREF
jgi:hypothetical protein